MMGLIAVIFIVVTAYYGGNRILDTEYDELGMKVAGFFFGVLVWCGIAAVTIGLYGVYCGVNAL